MIDFVKISIKNSNIERLKEVLEFKTEFYEATGEVSSKMVAEYNFCKIAIYKSGSVYFAGSIHKLWNSINNIKSPNSTTVKKYKGFNGNIFTLTNIIEVRKHLEELFDCTPDQMIFQNIEFGVNTTPSFTPNLYLKGLLFHKNLQFEYRFRGNFAQVPHQRFTIKIYNKSEQYSMDQNTLRVELKVIKIEEIRQVGIKTFSDITSGRLEEVQKLLLRKFDEVVHFDYTIDKRQLSKLQKTLLLLYSNPRYWINSLKPQHRDRHKKRLKKITFKFSKNLHAQVRENIIQKCVIINQHSKPPKCVRINTSNIELNITQSKDDLSKKKKAYENEGELQNNPERIILKVCNN